MTKSVALPEGPIAYEDSGGPGAIVVLCHGLLMDATVWDEVVPLLPNDWRLVRPTFPLGGHRTAMVPQADLSFTGQAEILSGFLDALDLTGVTLVVSDLGYPLQLVSTGNERVRRLVILPSELYDNLPPGLPGKTIALAGRVPGGVFLSVQSLRVPGASRLPVTLGRLARRIPRRVLRSWLLGPRKSAAVRRDLVNYMRGGGRDELASATAGLAGKALPTLLIWSPQDKIMPISGARRLADEMADAVLVEVPNASVLLQLDEPALIAFNLRKFVAGPIN